MNTFFFFKLVLAVGNGNRALNDLYRTRVTRVIYIIAAGFTSALQDTINTGLMLFDMF